MSVGSALKLNLWAGVAVVAAAASRLLLRESAGLTGAGRAAVALLPLLPGLLYVRALRRWMRGLDEMQRQLQIEAVCFAALSMLLIVLTADLLRLAGFLPRMTFGWEGYMAVTFFLWALGLVRANRRFRFK